MDTTKFMMAMGQICRNHQCGDCMLNSFCQKIWYERTKEDVEKATKLVEELPENRPAKTRQTEFLKKFPNAAVSHGTINILPCWLDETLAEDCDNGYPRECVECRKEFWNKVIE